MKKVTVYSLRVYEVEVDASYDVAWFLHRKPSREDAEKHLKEFGIKVNDVVLNNLLHTGRAKSTDSIGLTTYLRLNSDNYTIKGDIIQRVND